MIISPPTHSGIKPRPFFLSLHFFGHYKQLFSCSYTFIALHFFIMAGNNIVTSLVCPVKGCDFTYTEEEPNVYKTHKAKVHISSVKVIYQNPIEEVVLSRTQDAFKCLRCDHSTQYPNVMQVGFLVFWFLFF